MTSGPFHKPAIKTLDEIISPHGALTRNSHGMVETDPDQTNEMLNIVIALCTLTGQPPSRLVEYFSMTPAQRVTMLPSAGLG